MTDLSGLTAGERTVQCRRLLVEEARKPFDLSQDLLFRIHLLKLGDKSHILFLSLHHVVADGWSIHLFTGELASIYEAFLAGRPSPLPELEIQFSDYASWQERVAEREIFVQQLAYWRRRLSNAPETLELPTDRPLPALRSSRGDAVYFGLGPELAAGLRALGIRHGATLFMTLQAAFAVLLARHGHQRDIWIGTPVACRNLKQVEPLIGLFVNTLVLRNNLSGNPSFHELLARVRQTVLQAFLHQDL